jgi:hypothetical protein
MKGIGYVDMEHKIQILKSLASIRLLEAVVLVKITQGELVRLLRREDGLE